MCGEWKNVVPVQLSGINSRRLQRTEVRYTQSVAELIVKNIEAKIIVIYSLFHKERIRIFTFIRMICHLYSRIYHVKLICIHPNPFSDVMILFTFIYIHIQIKQ